MHSDALQEILKDDFDALADRFENDKFSKQVLFKVTKKSRARMGVIFFAGGLGAAFAATQFSGVVKTISLYFAETSVPTATAVGDVSQIAATFLLAGALAATALVVRQDA